MDDVEKAEEEEVGDEDAQPQSQFPAYLSKKDQVVSKGVGEQAHRSNKLGCARGHGWTSPIFVLSGANAPAYHVCCNVLQIQ